MPSLFLKYPNDSTGVVKLSQWPYIQQGMQRNVQRIQDYYSLYPHAVASEHFLVTLLGAIAVPMNMALELYYDSVDAKAMNLSMALRMSSSIAPGRPFKGVFYGEGSTEFLLAVDDYFDYEYVHANWRTAQAIVPLLHPKSDLSLTPAFGKAYSKETGLSVIAINITMLAVQYRAFKLEQFATNPNAPMSVYQFIGGWVLPNMLKAQTDIALFNRFSRYVNKTPEGNNLSHYRHSFHVTDYTGSIDLSFKELSRNIENGARNFKTILKTIPSFFAKDMYQALLMPDVAATVQADWLLVNTRLRAIDTLLTLSGALCATANQDALNDLIREYRPSSVNNASFSQLPIANYSEFVDAKLRLSEIAGTR